MIHSQGRNLASQEPGILGVHAGENVKKSAQRGEGALSILVSIAFVVGALFWLRLDYLPASAVDLQQVVSLAAANPEAKAAVVASLKETPNPNRVELRRLRSRVNEIVVTGMARKVTGDKTLESPSERDAMRDRQAGARLAEIGSKPWREMSADERVAFLESKLLIALGVLFFVEIVLLGSRAVNRVKRGY